MSSRKQSKDIDAEKIDAVIEELRRAPEGLSADDLADLLELNRAGQKSLKDLLNRMQSMRLLRRYGQNYRFSGSDKTMIGIIRQRRRKMISFVPDDIQQRVPGQGVRGRIRVEPEDLNGAFDGDRVLASVSARQGERYGRVEMILRRGRLRIIGRLFHGFREPWVESLDEKFPFDIDLEGKPSTDLAAKLDDGWIVLVEITSYPIARRNPTGRIIERLGASSDAPGMDIQIVIHKHDLPHVFPDEVREEAEAVSPVVTRDQMAGRLDLRGEPTVTIDGETARDFDDAISLKRLDNGNFLLGVHIADVSFYVREGAPLDSEARLRGTSVYFPERAIPMLPERLSSGICSLNPKVDRLAMSALMEVDRRGRVVNYKLRETVIRSDERMTYTDVNKLLTHADPQLAMRYAGLYDLFKTMEELARILIKMRERRGAIDFNLPESVFEFDDEGRVAGVLRADRNIAHRIIEEFMLLANETVAGHMQRLRVPSLYRIHEEPQPQRVVEFAELAAAYGYGFPAEGVSSKDYQRLSHQLAGKPEERVMAYAMLRSLQRARYSAQNLGHFGLAAPVYTHFTSPIRRYPDLITHRILRALLKISPGLGDSGSAATGFDVGTAPGAVVTGLDKRNKSAKSKKQPPSALAPIPLGELELIAEESSERERAADAAENEIDEWRKAVFMAERMGEEFDGMIVNVRDFGFFVELDDFFIEGLAPVSALFDDFYEYDDRRHMLVGQDLGRRFRLGDRVRVRVDRVNVDRHLVDFSVVELNRKKSRRPSRHK
ncbi:MAG: VacB/RNase II family 3'-5' exoribonuclease [Blastocatellia bacterium]|nr:VacB/RNase II family 3'-5' exoribonuclease [Blastocatellia bacterium]